jgi:imidazolonepropionase
MDADLLILHATQLLTLRSPGGPKRGPEMSDPGLIPDGAVAVQGKTIVAVGPSAEVAAACRASMMIEAPGKVVLPGFVDPHTHALFAGARAGEFEMRLRGATYMEIMQAGGGIQSTVNATRSATWETLLQETRTRLEAMLAHGTTTAEVKTGYALEKEGELRMLRAILALDRDHHQALDLVPTFLAAHAVPQEYHDDPDGYVQQVVEEMLPAAAALWQEETAQEPRPAPLFCDVFCEKGAFDLAQSRRILGRARELGMGLKIHVDEFASLGGTALAVELGAASADHLVCTPEEELLALAGSNTIAVSLPGTPFGLGDPRYSPARKLIEAGGALALATDLNPGTCYCESMPFIIALACRAMRLSPSEAIAAATINAAHAIGWGARVGSLEVGKQADIVILDLPDYRHLAYRFGTNPVEVVVKRGQIAVVR